MTRFQNIVDGVQQDLRTKQKSVFEERTDEASATQYFQVRPDKTWIDTVLWLVWCIPLGQEENPLECFILCGLSLIIPSSKLGQMYLNLIIITKY